MPKMADEDKERIHVMIYASDMDKLRMRFSENIGVGVAIRQIVRTYLKGADSKIEELIRSMN